VVPLVPYEVLPSAGYVVLCSVPDVVLPEELDAAPSVVLGAVLPAKVAPVLLPMAGLTPHVRLDQLSEDAREHLVDVLMNLTVRVRGTRGFDSAQMSIGGVPVTEVEPATMSSRIVPGLHFAGETLDVVGPCGGYNLQFAFTSGVLAGVGAIR